MIGWCISLLIGCILFVGGGQTLLASNPTTTYTVTVKTSNNLGAGASKNDKVYIKLKGENGETAFQELKGKPGSFNNNKESQFTITAKDVGKIKQITVKKTATGIWEAWILKKMTIKNSKGTIYEFTYNNFISKFSGLEKTLTPNNIINPQGTGATPSPLKVSPTTSSSPSGSASTSPGSTPPSEAATPTSVSTAGPTSGEETTKGVGSAGSTISTTASSKPTASTGPTSENPSGPSSSTGPTNEKPSGPSSSTGPTSKKPSASGPSSSTSPTSKKPSGPSSSTGPTNEKPSGPSSSTGPTSKKPSGPSSSTSPTSKKPSGSSSSTGTTSKKPSGPSSSTSPTSKKPSGPSSSTSPTSKIPSGPSSSTVPTSKKPSGPSSSTSPTSKIPSGPSSSTGQTSKKLSGPSSSTGPTSKMPSGPSSTKPSGSSSTTPSASKPTSSTGPTSEKPTDSIGAKTSGPSSTKPSGSSSTMPSASKPTSSTGPTSEKPTDSIGAKTSGPSSAKPSGPSTATPSGPSSAKPSGSSTAKPSGPSKAKPSGPSRVKPSGPSTAKPFGPSSAKPSGASTNPTRSTVATSSGSASPSSSGKNMPTTAVTSGQTPPPANSFAMNLLREMNTMRLLHGAGPLLLERNMSQAAQKAAVKIAKQVSVPNDTETTYGINTCHVAGSTPGENAAKQCVSTWYKTVKDLDWPSPRVTTKSAQFARLVWKATTHVGIGVSGSNVVVYFDPPSNEVESAKDNISPVTDLSDGTSQVCPDGFKINGRSCFTFNPTPSTWEKAIEQCAHRGATLASLQSQEENTFVIGMLSGLKQSGTSEAWLGFTDRLTESRYQWVDGSTVNFHQFLSTEPTGVGENCVALKSATNETGWEDRECSDMIPSLCRRPAQGPITYKIAVLVEVGTDAQKPTVKSVIPPGNKDYASLIKERINSTNTGKPVEFVGESTETKPDGGYYSSVFVKTPPGSDSNIAQPLQDYLDAHNNHILPDSTDKVFVVSVTIINPGSGMCYSTCFTTCSNHCNPMCCSGSFIVNSPPAVAPAVVPPQVASYQQQSQPAYNYPNAHTYSSSPQTSYLPHLSYPYPSAQQNGPASSNPYMLSSSMGCVRACTKIPRNGFCPPYCPKKCCRTRLMRQGVM